MIRALNQLELLRSFLFVQYRYLGVIELKYIFFYLYKHLLDLIQLSKVWPLGDLPLLLNVGQEKGCVSFFWYGYGFRSRVRTRGTSASDHAWGILAGHYCAGVSRVLFGVSKDHVVLNPSKIHRVMNLYFQQRENSHLQIKIVVKLKMMGGTGKTILLLMNNILEISFSILIAAWICFI